jgi:hypothetical protein
VQRFSPLDATCLTAVNADGTPKDDPSAKLDGTAIRHFGAFFEQAWRENDYLWGRLDGAELAMRLLARQSDAAVDLTGNLRSALTAILDTEQAGLGRSARCAAPSPYRSRTLKRWDRTARRLNAPRPPDGRPGRHMRARCPAGRPCSADRARTTA